jgi:hypothetical protein
MVAMSAKRKTPYETCCLVQKELSSITGSGEGRSYPGRLLFFYTRLVTENILRKDTTGCVLSYLYYPL